MVVDWNGTGIKTYDTAEQLIEDFAQWRLKWYTKRYEHLKQRDNYELRYCLALKILFEKHFTKKLGTFSNRQALQAKVVAVLGDLVLDDVQVDRVVSLPTYRWTQEFEIEIEEKIAGLKAAIAEYEAILASSDRLRTIYLTELDELSRMKF